MVQKTNIFDQIKSHKTVNSIMLPPPQKLVITKSMYNYFIQLSILINASL